MLTTSVGSYTILAATGGVKVIAAEPIPATSEIRASDDGVGHRNVLYLRDAEEARRSVRAAPTMRVGRFTL